MAFIALFIICCFAIPVSFEIKNKGKDNTLTRGTSQLKGLISEYTTNISQTVYRQTTEHSMAFAQKANARKHINTVKQWLWLVVFIVISYFLIKLIWSVFGVLFSILMYPFT